MQFDKLIRKAIITEKATRLREMNQYQFEVAREANKYQIKNAVETMFNVKVKSVRTCSYRGKVRRLGYSVGNKPDWKKATVTLKEGFKIDLVEGV
jgi:large subunit ribosomal protein L23